tara:strand:+ start:1009 stop:1299 length:291 start_codon:yes stop_codon:yes gene_type:complete
MISKQLFDTFSVSTQEELTEEPFSFRECIKCEDYFDLGGTNNERQEQAMYCHTQDFECDDKKIEDYQNKNNFNIDDNVFCWDCIKTMRGELEGNEQ